MSSSSDRHAKTIDNAAISSALTPLLAYRHWFIGFSGGLDSTVLLHLAAAFLQTRRDDAEHKHSPVPDLTAIHVDHQLHQHSADWRDHCQQLCDGLGVPLIAESVTLAGGSGGLENTARDARYRVFNRHLTPNSVLLTAHHADDQAETLLMRLFRGAGMRGAAGIPDQRVTGSATLARPLLPFTRDQLAALAVSRSLVYIDDPSNDDTSLDRNYLRKKILPLVAARWPGYGAALGRFTGHAGQSSGLLDELADIDLQTVDVSSDHFGNSLAMTALARLSSHRRANLIRYWLTMHSMYTPSAAVMREIDALVNTRPAGACVVFGAYSLRLHNQRLYLVEEQRLHAAAAASGVVRHWSPGQPPLRFGCAQLVASSAPDDHTLGLQEGDYHIGQRVAGQRYRYHGMSRPLKKLFNEAGIPEWIRDSYPIICRGEAIAAVGDILVCDEFRVKGGWQLELDYWS